MVVLTDIKSISENSICVNPFCGCGKIKQDDNHIQKNLDTSLKTRNISDFFQVMFYIWNYYKENVSAVFLLPPLDEGDCKSKNPGNWNMVIGNHFFLLLLFKQSLGSLGLRCFNNRSNRL